MSSNRRPGALGNYLLVATVVFGLFAFVGMLAEERSDPVAPVQPVDAVTTDDLRRAADALDRLTRTRLTPREHRQVERVAEIVDGLANGTVTIAPTPPSTTAVPAPTQRGPATTSTVVTTQPHAHLSVDDWHNRWATTTVPPTTVAP